MIDLGSKYFLTHGPRLFTKRLPLLESINLEGFSQQQGIDYVRKFIYREKNFRGVQ